MGPCARMCQTHQGRDSPPPDFAKIRCQKVGKSEMGKILVLGQGVVRECVVGEGMVRVGVVAVAVLAGEAVQVVHERMGQGRARGG